MKRLLSRAPFLLILVFVCLAGAQQRGGRGRLLVTVAPDHSDWKYALGEKAVFTIKVQVNTAPAGGRGGRGGPGAPDAAAAPAAPVAPAQVAGSTLSWTLTSDNSAMPPLETATVKLGDEDVKVDAGTLKQPGFLRLTATVQEAGGSGGASRGMATAAFAPELIKPTTQEPDGFDKFWDDSKALLAKIPIGARRTEYAAKTTDTLNAYEVSFQVMSGDMGMSPSRIYGILTEPKAPGKYPALLRVPGAGVYGVPGIVKEGWDNVITLSIGIHGVPLTLPDQMYRDLMFGALSSYNRYNLDSKERYYYRRVYLGCIRAVDYLTSLPNWDGQNVAVVGGSQGGALAITTAALDPRVKALAAFHPALAEITGYMYNRAGGWPDLFKGPENRTKDKLETAAFYDVVNFARKVKVPGIYTWGFNDETVAPTSAYSAYNAIDAPKTLFIAKEMGHSISPVQDKLVADWLQEFLKTGKAPVEPRP